MRPWRWRRWSSDGYDDAERLSSRYDGGAERDLMLSGINKLQRALADAGFAPR
jgi:hypothetical protein